MKTIYLEIEKRSVRKLSNQNRDIFWFDRENNKLIKFNGGCLNFEYSIKEKKLMPVVSDLKSPKYEKHNNKDNILNWIKINENSFNMNINAEESSDSFIAKDVIDSEEKLVKDSLDNSKIRYL
jgi:hypothetical protein